MTPIKESLFCALTMLLSYSLKYDATMQFGSEYQYLAGTFCLHLIYVPQKDYSIPEYLILTCIHSFIHSIGTCRMRRFLAVLKSIFHSSLLYTLSFHPCPPASLPSSLTSSCHFISWSTSQPCCFQIHI
jgi:hypothetical protein